MTQRDEEKNQIQQFKGLSLPLFYFIWINNKAISQVFFNNVTRRR